tara:strand:+ start:314 stop:1285 length:972 start_codon:yes stop_codon:yes gene_type:complete
MGLKTFDVAPDQFKDGGVAQPDKEHWTSKEEIPTDKAMSDAETMQKADEDHQKANSGLKVSMKTKLALHMMRVEIPESAIDEINNYIDEELLTKDERFGQVKGNSTVSNTYSWGLVGQIKQNEKSAQIEFPITDETEGSVPAQVKTIIEQCARTYLKNAFDMDAVIDAFEAWSVHSYAGDYNPLHDHGVVTQQGLSCILYLKVPPQIEKINAEEQWNLANNSGAVDGFTYFQWGVNGRSDTKILRPATDEYVKPEKGVLMIFPNWLRHAVMPFSGEGERRTFSTNINVMDKLLLKQLGLTAPADQMEYMKNLRDKRQLATKRV